MNDDDGTIRTAVWRTITVNGRETRWTGEDIDGRELAKIAFPNADPARAGRALTVTYAGGPAHAAGILVPGSRIAVTDRQSFNVGLTDKS